MLELDLHKRLGQFTLNVAIAAHTGVTALFGPSGSGKTSLVQMVAGLSKPDRGRIQVGGQVLFDSDAGINLPPEQRGLGYVFQDARLFPHLTVRKNLEFGRKPDQPFPFDDIVGLLGIEQVLDRYPRTLSGGEKQRVAIGRALLASPRLMIMDEPLAALDEARKAEVLPYLVKLVRQNRLPILYVSHSMDEVIALADTLVLLDQGQLVTSGPVIDLLARPDLRYLTGRLDAGAVITATVTSRNDAEASTQLEFPGGPLEIGATQIPVGETLRLRIHAKDVGIALHPPGRTSVRNMLPVTITSLTPAEGNLVDVMLDAKGITLWAQVSRHSAADLELTPGLAVWAMVKAVSLGRS